MQYIAIIAVVLELAVSMASPDLATVHYQPRYSPCFAAVFIQNMYIADLYLLRD